MTRGTQAKIKFRVAALAGVSLAMLAAAPAAMAQSPAASGPAAQASESAAPVRFTLPAQDLGAALRSFSRQSKLSVLFDPQTVAGHRSVSVNARLTPVKALGRLLGSSGLTYKLGSTGTILIEPATPRPHQTAAAQPAPAAPAAPASVARAAEEPDDSGNAIVVTAQRREATLQDVPLSVDVVSGDMIDSMRLERLSEMAAFTPNLKVTETSASNRVFIRGIGSGSNPGFEQSVSTFYDNIYFGRGQQSRVPFFDIERVEVVRGPQSTQFGKNAVAGAINVVTRGPSSHPEFGGEFTAIPGNNDYSGDVYASGPLTDSMDGRVALHYRTSDGFLHNVVLDRDEESVDELMGRVTLKAELADGVDWQLKGSAGKFNSKGSTSQIYAIDEDLLYADIGEDTAHMLFPDAVFDHNTAIANTVPVADLIGAGPTTSPFDPVRSKNKSYFVANTLSFDVGGGTLSAISGYSAYRYSAIADLDFTPFPLVSRDPKENYDQLSQELRYHNDAGPIEYTLGLYYQYSNLRYSRGTDVDVTALGLPIKLSAINGFTQKTDTYSAFGEGVIPLADTVRLLTAVRVTSEKKSAHKSLIVAEFQQRTPTDDPMTLAIAAGALDFNSHDFRRSRTETTVEPAATIEVDAGNHLLFARVARGQKAGGYDAEDGLSQGDTPSDGFEFKKETALAFEMGAKLDFGAADLNLTGFYTTYDDLQVTNFNGTSFVVDNAAKAVVKGIEAELYWTLAEGLKLRGAMAYLDFEFDKYRNAACTVGQEAVTPDGEVCSQDLSGRTGVMTPKWSSSVGLNYKREISSDGTELDAAVNVNYSSGYFLEFDLDPNLRQKAYAKIDAKLGFKFDDGRYGIAVFGRNLTDKLTTQFGNDVPLFAGAYRSVTDQPRVIGVQGSMSF